MIYLKLYLTLFIEFFKIGLFSIGGGAATIPFLMDLSQEKGWFSIDQLSNLIDDIKNGGIYGIF